MGRVTEEGRKQAPPSLHGKGAGGFGPGAPSPARGAGGGRPTGGGRLAAVTGYRDDPMPYTTNNYYADPIAGCQAPVAILAALAYRERTGKGQYIDVSLHEGGIGFFPETFLEYTLGGRETPPRGNRH